ncbi:MAG: glycosyltransferase family 2 protein [Nitrospirota bacterium]
MAETSIPPPLFSVVVPVYCEASCLETSLDAIAREAGTLNERFEIIVVDDGSTDDTWAVLHRISIRLPFVGGISFSRNFGKDAAIAAGIESARGQAVIVMDADLQHPPELIPVMLRLWRESGADVVDAVKTYSNRESLAKRLRAMIFYTLLSRLSAYDLTGSSDYKLLDRRVVDAWLRLDERSLFFRGLTAWMGFRHVRVPFIVPERVSGQTRWSVYRLIKLAATAVTAFSSLPLHLITITGIGFFAFAVVLGIQTLLVKFHGDAVSGFATVIILLLIIGSALMIGLGIIGEYLSRIYIEVKHRPRYIVAATMSASGINPSSQSHF